MSNRNGASVYDRASVFDCCRAAIDERLSDDNNGCRRASDDHLRDAPEEDPRYSFPSVAADDDRVELSLFNSADDRLSRFSDIDLGFEFAIVFRRDRRRILEELLAVFAALFGAEFPGVSDAVQYPAGIGTTYRAVTAASGNVSKAYSSAFSAGPESSYGTRICPLILRWTAGATIMVCVCDRTRLRNTFPSRGAVTTMERGLFSVASLTRSESHYSRSACC